LIRRRWDVDAHPEVPGGVDGDVGGAHAARVRRRAGAGLTVGEREEEAVDGAVWALGEIASDLEGSRARTWSRTIHGRAGGVILVLAVSRLSFLASIVILDM
jgi:hypothetical protein